MDVGFTAKVFAALFAIMNPIGCLPIFLAFTSGMDESEQRRTAILVTMTVTIACVVSAAAGNAILGFFGLDVDHFRLAGGLIVLLIALSMLQGEDSPAHSGSGREQAHFATASNIAVYPLAIPMMVGPGTISTIIVYAEQIGDGGQLAGVVLAIAGNVGLLGVLLIAAPSIGHRVSPMVLSLTKRLMGMILAAVAMQMLVAGLRNLFPGLA